MGQAMIFGLIVAGSGVIVCLENHKELFKNIRNLTK